MSQVECRLLNCLLSSDADDPHTLLILAEEELVAVDLTTAGWPCYELPYLNSIHASAILSATHVANVPQAFWNRIRDAGNKQCADCSIHVSRLSCVAYFAAFFLLPPKKEIIFFEPVFASAPPRELCGSSTFYLRILDNKRLWIEFDYCWLSVQGLSAAQEQFTKKEYLF